jgi:hypothetical protein
MHYTDERRAVLAVIRLRAKGKCAAVVIDKYKHKKKKCDEQ